MYNKSSMSQFSESAPPLEMVNSRWSGMNPACEVAPSEWSLSYNSDTNANDTLGNDACVISSACCQWYLRACGRACAVACALVCFWVVCLLCWSFLQSLGSVGGAAPPEQEFKSRRTWGGSGSSQSRNNERAEKQQLCPQKCVQPDLFLFKMYRNMFLSAPALNSINIFAVLKHPVTSNDV